MTLEYYLRGNASRYWYQVDVDFDFSKKLPDLPERAIMDINGAVAELMHEIFEHTDSNKRKVSAKLESGKLVIELAWNGTPLENYKIEQVNDRYKAGMSSDKNTFAGGAFSAAYRIGN